jgi:hypothetical protein
MRGTTGVKPLTHANTHDDNITELAHLLYNYLYVSMARLYTYVDRLVCISICAMHADQHFMHVGIPIISLAPTSTKVTKCATAEYAWPWAARPEAWPEVRPKKLNPRPEKVGPMVGPRWAWVA